MKYLFRNLCAGLGASLLMAACGGGGGDDGPRVAAPTATVKAEQDRVEVGTAARLTGTGSSPNGGSLRYIWRVSDKPAGSAVALGDASLAEVVLTPDVAGSYTVSLVVDDGKAQSAEAQATFSAYSTRPVANAGPDYSIVPGTVQLAAGLSQPPEGGDAARLSYSWTLTEQPEGSTAALDNAASASPRFTAKEVGVYKASLVAHYGDKSSDADEVVVTVVKGNVPAVAAVTINGRDLFGADVKDNPITVVRGQKVLLDASASSDPDRPGDNSHLQYRWEFGSTYSPSRPNGSNAVLEGARTAQASFTPDIATTFPLTLHIYDGVARTSQGVGVVVVKPEGAANTPPQVITPLPPSGNNTYEVELGATVSFMTWTAGYDADGNSINSNPLKYDWRWVSYPQGFDPDTGSTFTVYYNSTFKPNVAGDYVVEVRAHDGIEYGPWVSQRYTAMMGANRAPTAAAAVSTGNTTVRAGNTVAFTGRNSSDPDGNQLSYAWTLVDQPDGSASVLENANTANPALKTDKPGYYTVALVVTDSHGFPSAAASRVTINAKSSNHAPLVRMSAAYAYDALQPMVIGAFGTQTWTNNVTKVTETYERWMASGFKIDAYDPDLDPLTYVWSLAQAPAGAALKVPNYGTFCTNNVNADQNQMAADKTTYLNYLETVLSLRAWECKDLYLAPSVPGVYALEMVVYDGSDRVGPFSATLHAVARQNYPTLLLEDRLESDIASVDRYNATVAAPTINGSFMSVGTRTMPAIQQLFPWKLPSNAAYGISMLVDPDYNSYKGGVDIRYKRFQLTAFDQDYTIADLAALSPAEGYVARFDGLVDGQTIKKGQTVVFDLVLQFPAQRPATQEAFRALANRMNWQFRIAERSGWTFEHGLYMY